MRTESTAVGHRAEQLELVQESVQESTKARSEIHTGAAKDRHLQRREAVSLAERDSHHYEGKYFWAHFDTYIESTVLRNVRM